MFKQLQRSINSTEENEDHLTAGDILYKFNRECLMNKKKSELISALQSINQVCELKVIRKLNYKSPKFKTEETPYDYNDIFARNSIKLTMRSSNYEHPGALHARRIRSRSKLIDILDKSDENGKFFLDR